MIKGADKKVISKKFSVGKKNAKKLRQGEKMTSP